MSYKPEDYQYYKSRGICPYCRQQDAEPNRTACYECGEKQRKYRARERERMTADKLSHIIQNNRRTQKTAV